METMETMLQERPRTLTEIVRDLPAEAQRTLSDLHIRYLGDSAEVLLHFLALSPDPGRVPSTRLADLTLPLAMAPSVEEQLRELQAVEQATLGTLDAVRRDGGVAAVKAGYWSTTWSVKTHAGSRQERADWQQQLRARAASTGRPPIYDEPRTGLYLRLSDRLIAALDARAGSDGNRTATIEQVLREALGLPPLGSER